MIVDSHGRALLMTEPRCGPHDGRLGWEEAMQWKGRRQSTNVEDRRRVGGGQVALGGGIGAIIITLVGLFLTGQLGGNIFGDSGLSIPTGGGGATTTVSLSAEQVAMGEFVSVVLADTEDFWTQKFKESDLVYEPPTLVLFTGSVDTASGYATSATGPFYSPADKSVYIDLSFFEEMATKYGAGGDFAQAYVIAHEVGHHVQNLLGLLSQVTAQQQRAGETEKNELSVRLELQADFYAGAWGYYEHQSGWLEEGDIDEALNAASAIGDDRLQKQAQGYVVPDSFTHGTSAQRSRWFKLGYTTGDLSKDDTFSPAYDDL
jgi:predicted metalloprotease